MKPIKSRGKNPVPNDVHCRCCNAPHTYIYDNTGGRGQFLCKVCDTHFNRQNYIDNPPELCCHHCGKALELKKKRKLFNIHISTEYRWFKQIIERLNRTFKFSYKVTNRLWL